MKICIVIPVYKKFAELTKNEVASIKQCYAVLNKYTIFLAAPEGLDLTGYYQLSVGETVVDESRFKEKYFKSIEGYSRLLLISDFYRTYLAYDYMLIYQPDAWVFKDELEYWCNLNYDYIGAPWIGKEWAYNLALNGTKLRQIRNKVKQPTKVKVVGNGGFSLRKIKTFIFLSTLFKKRINKLPYDFNEDMFWGLIMPSYYPFYRIPTNETALQFSFEVSPSQCFAINKLKLPFGCHAWEKYEIEFWKEYIHIQE